jgi:transcriptional regulator with XRE-family HTH domain
MNYSIAHIARKLKAARQAKGLSQRQLSQLAAVPQSHISKIESGAVDLRLSSLIELSRVLELELMLVPRKTIPAINSIVRSSERSAKNIGTSTSSIQKELKRIENTIASLTREGPANKELAQIQRQARDLQRFQVSDSYLMNIRDAGKTLQAIKNDTNNPDLIRNSLSEFQNLRNSLANASVELPEPEIVRPAYSLDEDNDG